MTRLAESSEQRYRALVESSRGLICTHDMAGILLSVNRAAADRLGYAADELVGRSLGDVLAPSVRAQFPQYLERLAH
ncbi:MAG TPA: PAS domain S-box protein, partial [Methylomirabilota bacterium]|nr:PAS domain S-box protein [Methylomirabilota bacterium]